MPIYEYKCENDHVFDIMQSMSEEPLAECVECGAPVKKVLHPVGISFKGSGFYSTDYSKKNSKPEATKETSKGGESSTNGASDSGDGAAKKPEKAATETAKKED